MAIGAAGYAAIVSAVAAAGGAVQANESQRAAKSGRKRQGEAQQRAEAAAASQQRDNEIAQNRANRKKPDISAILAGAQAGRGGIGGTSLTGPGGVDGGSVLLGGNKPLGG